MKDLFSVNELENFLNEEDGIGVVEIILILVVLIMLILLFKGKIVEIVNSAFEQLDSDSESVRDALE